MTFTDQQKAMLEAPLSRDAVKGRNQAGRNVSYIEGWHAIAEANRIFGFDAWTRETVDLRCVAEHPREIGRDKAPGFAVTYICKVRVMVGNVCREGCGAGHGIDRDIGQAHESALKEAETDAMKRALMTFGNPFGLALYDKQQTNVADERPVQMTDNFAERVEFMVTCRETISNYTDPAALGAWWNSEDQKAARRAHNLDNSQVEALKTAVIDRRNELTAKEAA